MSEAAPQFPERDRALAIVLACMAPAWCGAGLLDWLWHRRTKIEETAGPRESLTHLLMLGESGIPIVVAAVCAIEPETIALMALGAVAHELTAMWDVAYASPRRKIAPREQHTHSVLEVVPFAGLATVVALYPDKARALFSSSRERRPALRLKQGRVPLMLRLGVAAGVGGVLALAYIEEFVRCWRVRATLRRLPIPEEPPITPAHRWAYLRDAEGYEA